MEKETTDLKTNFDYSGNQTVEKPYEKCTVLKYQGKFLLKTCAKFTRGKTYLEVIQDSQNCMFGKVGLGCNPTVKNKVKKFSRFFSKSKPNDMSFIFC